MYLRNEIVLDGKVQKDVKYFDELINFNISAITGTYLTLDNYKKNRYTFIKVVYDGEITEKINEIIQPGNFVRICGKLDSERYLSKSGKPVYNKVLVVNKISKLEYDSNLGILIEVV